MLTCLVPVLFTLYIQDVLKLKKNNSGAKGLIRVKSRDALLRGLLVCVGSYLKSVLSYKFLILDTCHPGILYLREQRCLDPWLFFEAKKGSASNRVSGNTELDDTPKVTSLVEAAVSQQPCGMSHMKGTFSLGITAGINQWSRVWTACKT
jgi:hypothetical protein